MQIEHLHCKDTIPKIWNKYSQKRNCAASSLIRPNFHIYVSVSDLYIPTNVMNIRQENRWTHHGNIYIAHINMNVEIGTAAAQCPVWEYINGIFVAVYSGTPVWINNSNRELSWSIKTHSISWNSMYIYVGFLSVDKDEELKRRRFVPFFLWAGAVETNEKSGKVLHEPLPNPPGRPQTVIGHIMYSSCIFRDRFVGEEAGLRTYKTSSL